MLGRLFCVVGIEKQGVFVLLFIKSWVKNLERYGMLRNNVELDLKTKFIEEGTTQTEIAETIGVSLPYVNRITKGREQIVNKTFVKIMDELGYDVELTYVRRKKG